MTPERKAWWDSLPKEEKRVRNAIKESKRKIKWVKEELPHSFGHYGEAIKDGLSRNKFLIKALRKQIAMRPIVFKYPGYKSYECPRCREGAITYLPHCSMCGQKLRWKECVD